MTPGDVAAAASCLLAPSGIFARGSVVFASGEAAPAAASGAPARSVMLLGNRGGSMWPHFQRWLRARDPVPENPLDTWSRETIGTVARRFGLRAAFPSDRPYLPFQQWAMRAEGLRPSPLGILMHPELGLWHAYRGALLFEVEIPIQEARNPIHLCDACVGKPCMNSCPADAVSGAGLDAGRCLEHIRGTAGAACREGGCIARNACPHDRHRYPAAQHAFHLAALMGNNPPVS